MSEPSDYEVKYAAEIKRAAETGRAQRAADGTIILDPTPQVCPFEVDAHRAIRQNDLRRVAHILSRAAYEQGEETIEEMFDFGPPVRS